MRNNRLADFLVLAAVVAGAAYFTTLNKGPSATPSATPSAVTSSGSQQRASQFPDRAVPFTLPRVGGDREGGSELVYDGKSAAVITLTAVGCGGCIERIPRDKELNALAHQAGLPIYNVLVYCGDVPSGKAFIEANHPQADAIVIDPGGQVFVNQYLGSDNNCWMVIGSQGEFLYRGPENLAAMKAALAQLGAESGGRSL